MIKSFKCKETEKIFNRNFSNKWTRNLQKKAYRKLIMLKNSRRLNDLRIPPANRLEKLKGDRKNQYSIRVNSQYRICFNWKTSDACDVEIVDYHS